MRTFGGYRNHEDRIKDARAANAAKLAARINSRTARDIASTTDELLIELIDKTVLGNMIAIAGNDMFGRDIQLAAVKAVSDAMFPDQRRG